MSIEQRQLEAELITEITDKSTKDAAIMDLKRKWERADNSGMGRVVGVLIVVVLTAGLSGWLGGYYSEQRVAKDIQKIMETADTKFMSGSGYHLDERNSDVYHDIRMYLRNII